jgi:hypothetical protein
MGDEEEVRPAVTAIAQVSFNPARDQGRRIMLLMSFGVPGGDRPARCLTPCGRSVVRSRRASELAERKGYRTERAPRTRHCAAYALSIKPVEKWTDVMFFFLSTKFLPPIAATARRRQMINVSGRSTVRHPR